MAIKDLHQGGDGHQSKGVVIRHHDVKVMFDNMASNSGLNVLTKKSWFLNFGQCYAMLKCTHMGVCLCHGHVTEPVTYHWDKKPT